MKCKIRAGKANGKNCWILDVSYQGVRRRKYFNKRWEAGRFDTLSWLTEKANDEPMGDQTLLRVARDADTYLISYHDNNKPKQKGYATTESV